MKKLFKISFTGDIMCEKPLMKSSKKKGTYNFDSVFKNIQNKFNESNVIVGNLETIFAGKNQGYTKDLYSFNTPDEFLESLSKSGINYVSTANNHCLDRGIDGLNRTIDLLDKYQIKHFGTYKSLEERKPYEVIEVNNHKIALISYTYGTNVAENGIIFNDTSDYHVNLLKSQAKELEKFNKTLKANSFRGKISKYIRKFTTLEERMKIKKLFGILNNKPSIDNFNDDDLCEKYLNKLRSDIETAKKETDFVIVCLHCGGLFNKQIGSYTKYITKEIKNAGANVIIGNHPHIVQPLEIDNCLCTYSLGNFSISPSSIYIIKDNLPEYSILFHLYFNESNLTLNKATFSILKIEEFKNHQLTVYPVLDLYSKLSPEKKNKLKNECTKIYNTFMNTNHKEIDIQDEYLCYEAKGE